MNIPEEVKIILDDNLITHGRLSLNPLSRSKHHAVTDYDKVYLKVLKPGTMSRAAMLKSEVDFAFNTNYGTNPLMESIVHKDSKGRLMVMSAWEYEQQISILNSINPMQIAQAASELYKIHSFPKYKSLRRSTDEEFQDYGFCLTSYSFNFLDSAHQNKIRNLYKHIIQPVTESLMLNPETNVVAHGQATLNKIITKPGRVQWVDYEEVRSAPREYDASRMFLQLHHRIGRPDLWELFRSHYESKLGRPLNNSMLEQYALLHLARRALELASTTLHTMNHEKLAAFLQEITELLIGKKDLVRTAFTHISR
jgi:hypothetical protein